MPAVKIIVFLELEQRWFIYGLETVSIKFITHFGRVIQRIMDTPDKPGYDRLV